MNKLIGVYLIKCKISNNFYVGSSVNIQHRFSVHKNELKKQVHHCIPLQNSWNKYGSENFEFIIIEFCIKEETLIREQYYIDTLKPEYNICLSSSAPMTGRKHKQETIEKFKKRKVKSGTEHYLYGKKMSEEHKKNVIASRIGHKHTAETRKKMSDTSKRLNRSKDLDKSREERKKKIMDNHGNFFKSLMDASKFWNMSVQAVCDNLKGRSIKTSKGIIFKYV